MGSRFSGPSVARNARTGIKAVSESTRSCRSPRRSAGSSWRAAARLQIAEQAAQEGVWNLRQSGLNKVRNGMTSLEEINRVTVD